MYCLMMILDSYLCMIKLLWKKINAVDKNILQLTIMIIILGLFFRLLLLGDRSQCRRYCKIEDRMTIRLKILIKILLHKTTGIMKTPALLALKRYFSN